MSYPITGISSIATSQVLAELARAFELRSGRTVAIESVGGLDAAKRVQAGEAFDVVVLAAGAIDRLAGSGHVLAGTKVDRVHSGVAVAVRAGAQRPDIGSESAVRQAVLSARSIGISTGPSGVQLAQLFQRWGICAQIAGRIVTTKPGVPVGSLVASGEVELGFQQLSELMHLTGIDVIGPLPPAIQIITTFSAAVCSTSVQTAAARALLDFLASPDAAAAKRKQGMAPA